jgi:hypothetical protein
MARDYFVKCALKSLASFVRPELARGFDEALGLLGIVGRRFGLAWHLLMVPQIGRLLKGGHGCGS